MSDQIPRGPRRALFANQNFRWFTAGSFISILGDQFTLIAMPWLVLKLTGDTIILGLVVALMSVPRAIFILIGGAFVDRYSPKSVLLNTKFINTALLAIFAVLILYNRIELWMVYGFSLALGLSTAFSIPSATSILPLIVDAKQLSPANSMIMAQRQICLMAGPLLAGILIAVFSGENSGAMSNFSGLGLAFLFDALSYLISAWTLSKVAVVARNRGEQRVLKKVFASIGEGVRHFWQDGQLRALCLYYAGICFFIAGPMQVLLPVLTDIRFEKGADVFGSLIAAHGAGIFIGMLIAGMTSNARFCNLGMTILLLDGAGALLFVPMIYMNAVWQAALVLLLVGALSGFVQVAVFTWVQQRVPPNMLGRAMSVFMFIFVGLAPVSAAVTGIVLRFAPINMIFAGSGAALAAIVLLGLSSRQMRTIDETSVPAKKSA